MKPENNHQIYQLKISLNDIKPLIWRRIQVKDDIMLNELHQIIQVAFSWTDSHLHHFEYDDHFFGIPNDEDEEYTVLDDRGFPMCEFLVNKNETLKYVYDLGDTWEHTILLERIIKKGVLAQNPICLDGANNAPLEDCGGAGGFMCMLNEFKKSGTVRYQELITGKVKKYDPKYFDLAGINKGLKKLKLK